MLSINKEYKGNQNFKKKMICHKVANMSNRGLISEDGSTKATQLFAIPRSIFKSSAYDLSTKILDFGHYSTSLVFL